MSGETMVTRMCKKKYLISLCIYVSGWRFGRNVVMVIVPSSIGWLVEFVLAHSSYTPASFLQYIFFDPILLQIILMLSVT